MKNKVITELKRLAVENCGLLQPEAVVAKARSASSPLHSHFEWDNTIAAHQYRLEQARHLIRVSFEVLHGTDKETPIFVSLTTDRGQEAGGYRIVKNVMGDKQMREQMLADALAELRCFRMKYSRLKELSTVFSSIQKVQKK
jgi:hypothetical protein